ncbi:MAG: T9SS type A sorting domain-containing protein [Bacteroidota bacterium]|nr:T9SS type A sorting domain-containing protein [Bacteroidota bacterium]
MRKITRFFTVLAVAFLFGISSIFASHLFNVPHFVKQYENTIIKLISTKGLFKNGIYQPDVNYNELSGINQVNDCNIIANAGMDQTICQGDSVTLTASGGNTYKWEIENGQFLTSQSIIVRPAVTSTYIVTVTDTATGCSATDSVVVTVNPLPMADAGVNQTICYGDTTIISATGGDKYKWDNLKDTSNIYVNPAMTTTYNVNVSLNGCTAKDSVIVTVNPNPIAHIIAKDSIICFGDNDTLTASGGNTYAWSTGETSSVINITPTTKTTYTVTASNGKCISTADITIDVRKLPIINAGKDAAIYKGNNITLSATGGKTYVWNTGDSLQSITVSPINNTTYTVTGKDDYCFNTSKLSLTVIPVDTNKLKPSLWDSCSVSGTQRTINIIDVSSPIDSGFVNGNTFYGDLEKGQIFYNNLVNGKIVSVDVQIPFKLIDHDVATYVNIYKVDKSTKLPTGDPIGISNPVMMSNIDTTIGNNYTTTYTFNIPVILPDIYAISIQLPENDFSTINNNMLALYSTYPNCNNNDTLAIQKWNDGSWHTILSQWYINFDFAIFPKITHPVCDIVANAGNDQTICNGTSAKLKATGGLDYKWSNNANTDSTIVSPANTSTYIVTVSKLDCFATGSVVVNVTPLPTVDAGQGKTTCGGDTVVLTPSGADSYVWNDSISATSIKVYPTVTTTYKVVGTLNGCSASDIVVITSNPVPIANAGPDITICTGGTASISTTTTPNSTYKWNTGQTTPNFSVHPLVTTTYIVTISLSNCSATDDVVVTIIPKFAVNAGTDKTICYGDTLTLNATGGQNFKWSNNETTADIIIKPTTTTTYIVTSSTGNCSGKNSVIITVTPLPVPDAGANKTICYGDTATLTATGATSFVWDTNDSTSTSKVTPTITTTYTVTGTSNGCSASDFAIVKVNPLPPASAGTDKTICYGNNTILTATGGTKYKWDNASTQASITVAPTTTSSYNVTVTDNNNCSATTSIVVNVNSLPVVSSGADVTICRGDSFLITPSGADTYSWSNKTTDITAIVSPSVTSTYSVTGTKNGCTATDNIIISVNDVYLGNAGTDQTICKLQTTTLTATGGTSYSWNTGNRTAVIQDDPRATTTYTVTITKGNCSVTDNVVVTVKDNPTISAGNDVTICSGTSTTLSATGATTYIWSNNSNTQSSVVSPTTATTYTVTGTQNGCTAKSSVIVNVIASPVVKASSNVAICKGASTTISASGATNYTWSNNIYTINNTVSPANTTTYTVTGKSGACSASANVIVTVNSLPVADAGANQTICASQIATLTAKGGTKYAWNTGNFTTSIQVDPRVKTVYHVTVTDNNNCSAMDSVTVFVNSNPIVTATASKTTICSGTTDTLKASGASTYAWDNGIGTGNIKILNPTVTTKYSVTGTNSAGCSATTYITITTKTLPVITPTAISNSICIGTSDTLNVKGGSGYIWSTKETTSKIIVKPTATTTYFVTGTDGSCDGTSSIVITVNSIPVADAGVNQTICSSQVATLTANGGTKYSWNTGNFTSSINVDPRVTTIYHVTVSSNNCSAMDSVTVFVNPNPVVTLTANSNSICNGTSDTLNVKGAATYVWSTQETTQKITVKPTATTTYYVTGTNAGCTGTGIIIITVNSIPVANAGNDIEIKNDSSAVLTATGGTSYLWSNGAATASTTVKPTVQTTYIVTVTKNGCTATDDVVVSVITGIEQNINELTSLNVYPVPTDDYLNISFNSACINHADIKLVDVTGKNVYSEKISVNNSGFFKTINVSKLDKGIYLLLIETEKGIITRKITL